MQLCIYLSFTGQCEEAFRHYAALFSGEIIEHHRYAGSPMEQDCPDGWQEKTMHAELRLQGMSLMGADAFPSATPAIPMTGFSLTMQFDSEAEIERAYAQLAQNATVHMPLQQTFWAQRFAMLTDRFGVPWSLNFE